MNDNNTQTTRYVYMVNNTKKEIRKVPLTFTSPIDKFGFLEGLSAVVNAIKVGWDNFTKYDWGSSDSIDLVKDSECNLNEYQERGYVVK